MTDLSSLVVLIPGLAALVAAVVSYIGGVSLRYNVNGRKGGFTAGQFADWASMLICTGGVMAAAVLAWIVFWNVNHGVGAGQVEWLRWMEVAGWSVGFGALTDKLSATMFIVVTTVSACVHLYSVAYMEEDPSRRRFFIYLSAFTFAMLMLVSAPNMVQMFLGWEGVGVCSYLLIGFWHHKESANAAAMKAFIVNRVADAALLMGMFTLVVAFGALDYGAILPRVGELAGHTTSIGGYTFDMVSLAALLIFIGAMGKSAQFGLHTWLPDAMEGPTPVSALIHAATMVTAGVFLLCRMSPLYEAAPAVLHFVGWVGAITALFAATVGLTQRDIKRVIAYSTCSQLGYMFFAIGVSAYPAAMFHLTTHAFFKALLFLGAGSVIHAMHHEQDIFRMGALKKVLPITYGLMWLGSLALAGIPPFAGFFSKDLILESAFMAPDGSGWWLYAIGTLGAFMTAVYGFRIVFMAFDGKFTGDKHTLEHAHESGPIMLAAMAPLAIGAVLAGWLLKDMSHLEWWNGAIVIAEHHTALEGAHHTPWPAKYFPLVMAVGGIALSWWLFAKRRDVAKAVANEASIPYAISLNKWYIDELYDFVVVRPLRRLSRLLYRYGDGAMIDGFAINGLARTVGEFGQWARRVQTGYVVHYAFVMVVALVGCLAWLLWGAV